MTFKVEVTFTNGTKKKYPHDFPEKSWAERFIERQGIAGRDFGNPCYLDDDLFEMEKQENSQIKSLGIITPYH